MKSLIWGAPNPKTYMFLVSPCSRLCQVLSREWRCSWQRLSALLQLLLSDQKVYAYQGACYIRGFTVPPNILFHCHLSPNHLAWIAPPWMRPMGCSSVNETYGVLLREWDLWGAPPWMRHMGCSSVNETYGVLLREWDLWGAPPWMRPMGCSSVNETYGVLLREWDLWGAPPWMRPMGCITPVLCFLLFGVIMLHTYALYILVMYDITWCVIRRSMH